MESAVLPILLQIGVPGVILWWFMTRVENRLDSLAKALDRQTRTQLILILSLPGVPEPSQRQARELLKELPQ